MKKKTHSDRLWVLFNNNNNESAVCKYKISRLLKKITPRWPIMNDNFTFYS